MKKEYDELMEHIEVTPEMRRRILRHIQAEDIPASKPKVLRFPVLKRYLSIAACAVVLLALALVLPRFLAEPDQPPVLAGQGIEKSASLQDLSDAVGFALDEEFALPFAVEEVSYLSYWGELAEIQYSGAGQTAAFRKSAGSGDNSGDYTEYEDVTTLELSGHTVTLKGRSGAYSLAVWTDGAYACSLRLSQAATEQQWGGILCL